METKRMPRRRRAEAERKQVVVAYRRSERTQREFAAEAGISVSALQLWLGRYSKEAPAKSSWVEAPNLLAQVHPAAYTVKLPSGVSVEIRAGFRREELVCLLQALRSI